MHRSTLEWKREGRGRRGGTEAGRREGRRQRNNGNNVVVVVVVEPLTVNSKKRSTSINISELRVLQRDWANKQTCMRPFNVRMFEYLQTAAEKRITTLYSCMNWRMSADLQMNATNLSYHHPPSWLAWSQSSASSHLRPALHPESDHRSCCVSNRATPCMRH